jgi:hypothetical protein
VNTRELKSRLKARSREESAAKAVNDKELAVVKAVIGVSWFVALGRWCSFLAELFRKQGQYFFLLGIFVSYISLIHSAAEYGNAANKNLGKTANLIYTTVYFLFYVATAVGYLAIGATVCGPMLLTAMFIDPLVNLVRAIYSGVKSALADDHETKYFFKQRAYHHAAAASVGVLISGIFALLMVMTMPLAVSIALGALGIGLMIASVFVIPRMIAKLMGPAPQQVEPIMMRFRTSNDEDLALLPEQRIFSGNYYGNTITTVPYNLDELRDQINTLIRKIEGDYTSADGKFLERLWSENPKRRNKISALEFLKTIIREVQFVPIPDEASEAQPYPLAGYLFNFKDKNELCDKIAQLVLQKYPDAFQSAFKEIGDTQACFNKLFLCIITNDDLLPRYDNQIGLRQ